MPLKDGGCQHVCVPSGRGGKRVEWEKEKERESLRRFSRRALAPLCVCPQLCLASGSVLALLD